MGLRSSKSADAKRPSKKHQNPLLKKATKEVFVEIFKRVHQDDIYSVSQTCDYFDRVIQECNPVSVRINDIGFSIGSHFYFGHDGFSKYRIAALSLALIYKEMPILKAHGDLKFLELCTPISLGTFTTLLAKTVNLEVLLLGHNSLAAEGFSLTHFNFNLPQLKDLGILDDSSLVEENETLTENIFALLNGTFPKLETISVVTMGSKKTTVDYTQAILMLLQNHSKTIQNVKIDIQRPLCETLDVYRDIEEAALQVEFDQKKLKNLRLKKVDITFGNFFVGLKWWRRIWNKQREVRHLKLGVDKQLPPDFYVKPVEKSEQTLTFLYLGLEIFHNESKKWTPVSCCLFENCKSLKTLILFGTPDLKGRHPLPELDNLAKLPAELEHFEIHNCLVETHELSEMWPMWEPEEEELRKERRFKKFKLWCIGDDSKYGVTLDLLNLWLSKEEPIFSEFFIRGIKGDVMDLCKYVKLVQLGAKPPLGYCEIRGIYDHFTNGYHPPKATKLHPEEQLYMY